MAGARCSSSESEETLLLERKRRWMHGAPPSPEMEESWLRRRLISIRLFRPRSASGSSACGGAGTRRERAVVLDESHALRTPVARGGPTCAYSNSNQEKDREREGEGEGEREGEGSSLLP